MVSRFFNDLSVFAANCGLANAKRFSRFCSGLVLFHGHANKFFFNLAKGLFQRNYLIESSGLSGNYRVELHQDPFNVQKIFNLREGATREQDTLPKRMFKEPLNEGRDVITVEELDFMLDDYYKLRGWDSQGRPTVEQY